MAIKLTRLLSNFFFVSGCILTGMGFALVLYDRHICCDKGSDFIYYSIAALLSLILSMLFSYISSNLEEKRYNKIKEMILEDYKKYLEEKEENETDFTSAWKSSHPFIEPSEEDTAVIIAGDEEDE